MLLLILALTTAAPLPGLTVSRACRAVSADPTGVGECCNSCNDDYVLIGKHSGPSAGSGYLGGEPARKPMVWPCGMCITPKQCIALTGYVNTGHRLCVL